MKTVHIVALALAAAAAPVAGGEPPPGTAKLESLKGTIITMIAEDRGVPARIWAKGNNVRTELADGKQKVVILQLGDAMYTYMEGAKKAGKKQHLGHGLGAMGLIRQIEEIRAKGKKQGSEEIDGVRYDKYEYDVNAPAEMAVVYLAAETSLPRIWLSVLKSGKKDASVLRMHYRDMSANVDIPDHMFRLPPDVTFSEDARTGN